MTPKSPRVQALQAAAGGGGPSGAGGAGAAALPVTTADEKVISEMQEMFPGTNREKIVRATTLAAGDREKAMDLLLSQSIDSQQAKNQKVESLGKVLRDVIEQSRASLAVLQKLGMSVKKLMINIPGPSAPVSPRVGPSATAQVAAYVEDVKNSCKIILDKLHYIDTEINKNVMTVKKLVEMGGVVKQVREQLAAAEDACKAVLDKLDEADQGGSEASAAALKDENGLPPDSPASGARNYVIPYAELDIEKEIGKGAYGKVWGMGCFCFQSPQIKKSRFTRPSMRVARWRSSPWRCSRTSASATG